MRLFGFIMAVLVLVLSCMPCSDTDAAHSNERASVQAMHTSNPLGGKMDDCSPFCQCNCCAGFPLQSFSNSISLAIPETHITHSGFYNASISRIAIPIWQPPKLNR